MAVRNCMRKCLYEWRRGALTSLLGPLGRSVSSSNEGGQQQPDSIIPVPRYEPREGEDVATKRSRLVYQSRKRGILENGLLLSSFAQDNLSKFTPDQLDTYDHLINQLDNEWDLYYWMTGKEQVPEQFDSKVMDMLKEHTKNVNRQKRYSQPELYK